MDHDDIKDGHLSKYREILEDKYMKGRSSYSNSILPIENQKTQHSDLVLRSKRYSIKTLLQATMKLSLSTLSLFFLGHQALISGQVLDGVLGCTKQIGGKQTFNIQRLNMNL